MKTKLLNALIAVILFLLPTVTFGQVITLGTAANFVLFTTNGAMTNSGIPHLTHLTGNVGSNLAGSISGFGNVDGQMHVFDGVTGTCVTDVLSAYSQLNGATPTATHAVLLGVGETLTPGVYHIVANATLNSTLTLDALGNPNAVFIFQIQGTFSTAALSKVKLVNGALACNVYWKVEGLVSMASGTTMRGTIIANNAAIDMTSTLDTLEGRALSINGAVTMSAMMAYTPIGCGSPVLTGPAAPALVSAAPFAVFSSIGAVTSTPITYVTGDVGSNSTTTTGFNPLNVTGIIHTPPDAATAACAGSLNTVYNTLVALPADIELTDPANFGYDLVLTPHTYHLGALTMLNGNIYLNAEGNPNAVFVIQINGAFNTTTLSRIILINGTQVKNVFWKIDGAVHIYDNSVFNGQIIAAGAITLNTGDTLNGRALTIGGAVAINGSYINMSPQPCVASPITGTNHVCQGLTTTLSNPDGIGAWSSSNTNITIGSTSGVVTGIAPGTSVVTYTSTLTCVSTTTVTVNSLPSPITGANSVCVGSTINLSDITTGGAWSSSSTSLATVGTGTGIVTGVASGLPTITYTIASGCIATKTLTVNPLPNAGAITGLSGVCIGSSITLSDNVTGGVWSSNNTAVATIGSSSGVVTGVTAGSDIIRYVVTNTCGTATATMTITVNISSDPGTITGLSNVCAGSSITLSDNITGGTWSSANTTATVSASGVVTGVTAGTATISYTVNMGCGAASTTKTVTVNPIPNAGTITGASSVCVGSSITLSDGAAGGVWSSSNTTATISGLGVVTGATAGTDTIMYSVTSAGCTAIATKTVTVNPASGAGTITGPSSVCAGFSITLSDGVTGGVWSSSNTTATVSSGGVVTGLTGGTTTISYAVTNVCGTATATKIITINPLPDAGTITGPSSVCVGSSISLTDGASGGVWSSSNTNATVTGAGVVTGVAAGANTIRYTVTNSCGTIIASKFITVNPLPNAGSVTGITTVCPGATTNLSDIASGGVWTSVNTAIATIGSSTGVVSGVALGTSNISYTVTNSCGTAVAITIVTVSSSPNAGTITGTSTVCPGSTTALTDAIGGGVWTSVNTAVATISSTGVVTGIALGSTTISYTITNSCGTSVATYVVTVSSSPNAGIITGVSTVCPGFTTALYDGVGGGVWTSVNTATAVIDPSTGIVTGLTVGTTTISYTVTNSCGTAVATTIVTVSSSTNAGTITGITTVCTGFTIALSDAVGGGVWTSVNGAIATIGPSSGIVSGIASGTTTISYTVINSCGTAAATTIVTVSSSPNAGTITGLSSVCTGSTINLTDAATGGIWSSSNGNATVSGSGVVTGVLSGTDTIMYVVTNTCGTATAIKIITINVSPNAGSITGASNVCVGASITLFDGVTGGTWSNSNANVLMNNNVVTGVTAGTDTISYAINNGCGTATAIKIITVNPLPSVPVISTQAPSSACKGTMYQNYGTATLPLANTVYNWSTINAEVLAQGTLHQYALVSFFATSVAYVSLNVTILSTGCTNRSTLTVNVGPGVAETPVVSYFNNHFVCTPNNENSYQWGYDDVHSLDSTILPGEINEDYINTNPDFSNKYYWAMTTMGSCLQKTYYQVPTALQNVNNTVGISVYPNPVNTLLNITISSVVSDNIQIEVLNMMGQKVNTILAIDNKATIDVTALPAGYYLINCYRDGIRITGSRFIKN